MKKNANYQRLEQWWLDNSSPEAREDIWSYHGINFDWLYERILRAGLEQILIPGCREIDIRITSTRVSPSSLLIKFKFSFTTGFYPNYDELYAEDLPGVYAFDDQTNRLIRV